MDLKIAYIKLSHGLLSSSQLPVIATQALIDGLNSESLILLASEYEPHMSEVAPLFEAVIRELEIQISEQLKCSDLDNPKPLSTQSSEFSKIVLNALNQNKEIIVHQRFANTAGAGAGWYLIKQQSEWQKFLDSGKPKTAYTVILDKELPIRGIATDNLKDEAVKLFDELGDVMIGVFWEEDNRISLYSFEWDTRALKSKDAEQDMVRTKESIIRFFEKQKSKQVAIGRDLWVWGEKIEVISQITAYVPDEDGEVRPGAY